MKTYVKDVNTLDDQIQFYIKKNREQQNIFLQM